MILKNFEKIVKNFTNYLWKLKNCYLCTLLVK